MKRVYLILVGLLLIGASYESANVSAKEKLPTVYLDVGHSFDLIGSEVAVINTSYALEPLKIELNSVEFNAPQFALLSAPGLEVPLTQERWQDRHATLHALKNSTIITKSVSSYPDVVMLC